MKNILILGASRGLGDALSRGLPQAGDTAWLVSRGKPQSLMQQDAVNRIWIEADLSSNTTSQQIVAALDGQKLDALVYNVGIWESTAFSDDYDFEEINPVDHERILQVNLLSAIHCIQAVLPNLRQANHAKIILIGSISGVENTGSPEVAYVASKFGVRGIAHALRENLRADGIAVTCMNPGMIATEVPYAAGIDQALAQFNGIQIPVHDVVAIARCILSLSHASCVKEISMPAMADTWA
ncbi:SDR family NAD(P)-dependent oxidoreductase [Thermocoleostomius sinensis]|uniref:SDR family NAD(P)-dependent oxidoreductase n=1 Tax=Thermocoleostomius sinensis A174 TaxID=2016057 RepID=A0A9E8ZAZ6_9CYAN|nr:SDR family NAD(P)-dependent oxidoreductase [Thermocoleostomius sinensis]WAL59874.1 SDR family NAD(P)-dependent oxidoreductase [Thermocoleostomius sinensis A174]